MSKTCLEALVLDYANSLQCKGIKNFMLYKPFGDEYWNISPDAGRIAFCNLEAYDKNKVYNGITTLDFSLFEKDILGSKTGRMTALFNFFLVNAIESDKFYSANEMRNIDFKKEYSNISDAMFSSCYFNLRNTLGIAVKEDKESIISLAFDEEYNQFLRNYIKCLDADYLLVSGKTGCAVFNKLFPELHLEYDKISILNCKKIISIKHPSRIGYAYITSKISEIVKK